MTQFKRDAISGKWDTYSSNAHFERDLSVYVSASTSNEKVRVHNIYQSGSASTYYTAAEARLLAAELLAAADSLKLPVPEVSEVA